MPELERKATRLEVKDVDTKQGIFTGFFSSFGTVDSYGDVVDMGAFAKTIREWGPEGKQRIKCAYQHNPFGALLGKPLLLEERTFGAYHETKVSQTSYGKDVLLLIEDGVLTEQSFAFETIQFVPKSKSTDGHRHLTEVRLYEYGPQTWGANENTPITGVKASDLMNRMRRLDNHLKAGDLQDATMIAMLRQTMDLWAKALEAVADTPPNPAPETITVQTKTQVSKKGGSGVQTKAAPVSFSYEDRMRRLWASVRMIERIAYEYWDGDYSRYWMVETFDDEVIVEDVTDRSIHSIPWEIDAVGTATLGELTEVQRTYTPLLKAQQMAMLLRSVSNGASGIETKSGAGDQSAANDMIHFIHRMTVDLMDDAGRQTVLKGLFGSAGEESVKSVLSLLGDDQRAMVLAAIQPESEPGKSHSGASTDADRAPGPDDVHPDAEENRKRRQRELELLALQAGGH